MDEQEKASVWKSIQYLSVGFKVLNDNIKELCDILNEKGIIDVRTGVMNVGDIVDGNSDSYIEDDTDNGGYYGNDKNSLN